MKRRSFLRSLLAAPIAAPVAAKAVIAASSAPGIAATPKLNGILGRDTVSEFNAVLNCWETYTPGLKTSSLSSQLERIERETRQYFPV